MLLYLYSRGVENGRTRTESDQAGTAHSRVLEDCPMRVQKTLVPGRFMGPLYQGRHGVQLTTTYKYGRDGRW